MTSELICILIRERKFVDFDLSSQSPDPTWIISLIQDSLEINC